MDSFQVARTVDLMLEDEIMRCLKPDDIKVCFERIVKGYYGINYDRIDTQTIFTTLNLYIEERQLTVEEINIKRHELIRDGKMSEQNPEGMKMVAEIMRKAVSEAVEIKEEKKEALKPKREIQKSARDIFIQACFREFQEIVKKGSLLKNGDFIEHNGQPVNEIEYVQQKTAEYDIEQQDTIL